MQSSHAHVLHTSAGAYTDPTYQSLRSSASRGTPTRPTLDECGDIHTPEPAHASESRVSSNSLHGLHRGLHGLLRENCALRLGAHDLHRLHRGLHGLLRENRALRLGAHGLHRLHRLHRLRHGSKREFFWRTLETRKL